MSQVKKHVEWCLRKAERELKDSTDHKGLVKVAPDDKEALNHIVKAEHNLKALIFNKDNFSDWAVNMGFYAMYHCCLTILAKFGYESRNQECTLSVIDFLVEEEKISEHYKLYIDKIRKKPKSESEEEIMKEREET